MSTGINYEFNKETFMGTDPFDDLFNKTHNVPSTRQNVYDEVEDEEIPDFEIMEDVDEAVEDDYSEEEDLI